MPTLPASHLLSTMLRFRVVVMLLDCRPFVKRASTKNTIAADIFLRQYKHESTSFFKAYLDI